MSYNQPWFSDKEHFLVAKQTKTHQLFSSMSTAKTCVGTDFYIWSISDFTIITNTLSGLLKEVQGTIHN